jgi:exodeoxyribonuclease-3
VTGLDGAQLSLLDVPAPAVAMGERPKSTLRVATWNVQHAAPARSRRQATWIADQDVEVAVLTEVAVGHGATALAQALSEHGYMTHTPAVASNNARDYQVMLACRGGRMEVLLRPRAGHLPHRCAAARIRRDDLKVVVVGLYVPSRGSKERRNVDKRAFQTAVTALLPDLNDLASDDVPVLVVGDLNVVESGHVPAHANFGDWEYAFYRSFTANSFTDGFRRLHPDDVDHSWFGRRSGAGYRFDHLFTSLAHLPWLTACGYDHTPRERGLSDHAALTATIRRPPATPLRTPHPTTQATENPSAEPAALTIGSSQADGDWTRHGQAASDDGQPE